MLKTIEKKAYLEKLPKYKGNSINWQNSIGEKIRFIYGKIEGEVEIIKYNKDLHMLTIKYLGNEFEIKTNGLIKCSLGEMLKTKTIDYKYKNGDIVNEMLIVESKRLIRGNKTEKGYIYKCLKCNYVGEMYEYVLAGGCDCQACANRKISKGINDIATTHPEYIKYFVDIEDTFKYSKGANKK